MFPNNNTIINVAETSATSTVMGDREKYLKYLTAAENVFKQNNVVVGGNIATKMLLKQKREIDDFIIEGYSLSPRAHAIHIANVLYSVDADGFGKTTVMKTNIEDKDFSIYVNTRELIKIKYLPMLKGVSVSEAIMPSQCESIFQNTKLHCFGPELQLIDIYRLLSNPAKAGEWTSALEQEFALRKLLQAEIREKIKKTTGGGAKVSRSQVLDSLFLNIHEGKILIGEQAANILEFKGGNAKAKNTQRSHAKLYFVSADPIEKDIEMIKSLGFNLECQINSPNIPIDPRVKRITVYLKDADHREAIAEIFDIGNYELVPYVSKTTTIDTKKVTVRVGTPFVILRFYLVELWTILLLHKMKYIDAHATRTVLFDLIHKYEVCANILTNILRKIDAEEMDLEQLFPKNCIGVMVDADLFAKRKMLSAPKKRFLPPYYPARKNSKSAD